jgi:replicative DNA helicase
MRKKMEHPELYRPISTNIQALDNVIGGITEETLIYIGGAHKTGKTALAQHFATCVASAKRGKVVYFQLEESKRQMAVRSMTRLTTHTDRTVFRDLSIQEHNWQELETAARQLDPVNLWFDDQVFKAEQIIATAAKLEAKYVVVDYLQLLGDFPDMKEAERLSAVSRKFVEARSKQHATYIVVYQLNEKGKAHGTRAVYKDADIALEIKPAIEKVTGSAVDGILAIDIVASRISGGVHGKIEVAFSGAHSRITDIVSIDINDIDLERNYP